MSRSPAYIDADRMCAVVLERVAALTASYGSPQTISMATYLTRHDYDYLRSGDKWTWEHHTEVARLTQSLLATHNIAIRLVPCTAEGCAAWLNKEGLIGSTANRAAYIGLITNGES